MKILGDGHLQPLPISSNLQGQLLRQERPLTVAEKLAEAAEVPAPPSAKKAAKSTAQQVFFWTKDVSKGGSWWVKGRSSVKRSGYNLPIVWVFNQQQHWENNG